MKTTCRLLKKILQSQPEEPNSTVIDAVTKVLDRLLVVGVTDTDPSVRFGVLTSLDPAFDTVLGQADALSYLFVAMQDEVFEIREVALFVYGRLSTKNPAYVIPSLRKILIQFLTELEHSGLTRNREQAAKMLDRLVVSSPQLVRPYVEPVLKVSLWGLL